MSKPKVDKEHAVFLSSDEIPTSWYNIIIYPKAVMTKPRDLKV